MWLKLDSYELVKDVRRQEEVLKVDGCNGWVEVRRKLICGPSEKITTINVSMGGGGGGGNRSSYKRQAGYISPAILDYVTKHSNKPFAIDACVHSDCTCTC